MSTSDQKIPPGFRPAPRKRRRTTTETSHQKYEHQETSLLLNTVSKVPALRAMIWALIVAIIPASLVPPAPYRPKPPKTPPVVARGDEGAPWLIEEIARARTEWLAELTATYMERGFSKEVAQEFALASITMIVAQDTAKRLDAGELPDIVHSRLVLMQWMEVLPEEGKKIFQEFDKTTVALMRNESHQAGLDPAQIEYLVHSLTAEEQELLRRCILQLYDMHIRGMAHYAEEEFAVPDFFNDEIGGPPELKALVAQGLLNEALVEAMIMKPMAERARLAFFAENMSQLLSLRLMVEPSSLDAKPQAESDRPATGNLGWDNEAFRRRIQYLMVYTMVEQGEFLTRQLDPQYDDHAGPVTPDMREIILHAARQETWRARRHLRLMLQLKQVDPKARLTKQEAAILVSLGLPYKEPQTLDEIRADLRTVHRWENAVNPLRSEKEKPIASSRQSDTEEIVLPDGGEPIMGRKAFRKMKEGGEMLP